MTTPAVPYTDAQIAGIERVAALADQDTTIPRLLANLAAMRTERDEARERVAALENERDTMRSALDESRGQVRTLRLTLDQDVLTEAALCDQIRHIKAQLHQEREADRPLRHEVEQVRAELEAMRAAARALACAIACEHGGGLDASVATLAGPDVPSRMAAPLRALLAILPLETK